MKGTKNLFSWLCLFDKQLQKFVFSSCNKHNNYFIRQNKKEKKTNVILKFKSEQQSWLWNFLIPFVNNHEWLSDEYLLLREFSESFRLKKTNNSFLNWLNTNNCIFNYFIYFNWIKSTSKRQQRVGRRRRRWRWWCWWRRKLHDERLLLTARKSEKNTT